MQVVCNPLQFDLSVNESEKFKLLCHKSTGLLKAILKRLKKEAFTAELTHIKGKKIDITTESEAQAVVDAIGGADAVVRNIEKTQAFLVKQHLRLQRLRCNKMVCVN